MVRWGVNGGAWALFPAVPSRDVEASGEDSGVALGDAPTTRREGQGGSEKRVPTGRRRGVPARRHDETDRPYGEGSARVFAAPPCGS